MKTVADEAMAALKADAENEDYKAVVEGKVAAPSLHYLCINHTRIPQDVATMLRICSRCTVFSSFFRFYWR